MKDKESEKPNYTATTPPAGRTDPAAEAQAGGMPPEGDLAFARAAASEALTRGGKDVSVDLYLDAIYVLRGSVGFAIITSDLFSPLSSSMVESMAKKALAKVYAAANH